MIRIASDALTVTINPRVGGTITAIMHRPTGLSVLGEVPWQPVDAPIDSLAAPDEALWLTRYTGGWPLLFPNGGDACVFDGVFHGFHGEASIAPWTAKASAQSVEMTRSFVTVPVTMHRELSVEGDLLVIRERLRMTGALPVDVMWGHHATFGSDLLAGPFEISSGAHRATVDETYDPAANPLSPGATGAWPIVAGKAGDVDLSRPVSPMAAQAYLHDWASPWAAIARLDGAIGAALSWDAARFACAWLWFELEGTQDAPWLGRGRLIGIEPCTTRPALGLAESKRGGGALLKLEPGALLETELRLHVFKPEGRIAAVDGTGRALFAA